MKDWDNLISDLIFSDNTVYDINISEYIEDTYNYSVFIKQFKVIMQKAGAIIIKEEINFSSNIIIWTLKVKK